MTIRADLILQQLGIRRWIPRMQGHALADSAEIWQDQIDAQSMPIEQTVPNPQDLHTMQRGASTDSLHPQTTSAHTVLAPLATASQSATDHQLAARDLATMQSATVDEAVDTLTISTATFQIELLQHKQFVICAVVQDTQQMELWRNIQRASQTESLQFKWPVEIKDWQVTDATLQSYLQGFLLAQQSRVLMTLGDIHIPIIEQQIAPQYRFAALAEMLQQPLLKRELWQVIQKFLG